MCTLPPRNTHTHTHTHAHFIQVHAVWNSSCSPLYCLPFLWSDVSRSCGGSATTVQWALSSWPDIRRFLAAATNTSVYSFTYCHIVDVWYSINCYHLWYRSWLLSPWHCFLYAINAVGTARSTSEVKWVAIILNSLRLFRVRLCLSTLHTFCWVFPIFRDTAVSLVLLSVSAILERRVFPRRIEVCIVSCILLEAIIPSSNF